MRITHEMDGILACYKINSVRCSMVIVNKDYLYRGRLRPITPQAKDGNRP
jgi:hypothetical protein